MRWRRDAAGERRAGERRRVARLDKVFPVWLVGEDGEAHGVARNISPGGMFVETPVLQPIGSRVKVTFSAGGAEMNALGEVRYVCHLTGRPEAGGRGPISVTGIGIRFLGFEDLAPGAAAPAPSIH